MVKRFRMVTLGLSIGLLLVLAFGSPVSAFTVIDLSGNYGDFGTSPQHPDDSSHPGAVCGYGAADVDGFVHLERVKVFRWKAGAYDRTSANDHQQVTFELTVQRSKDGGTHWKTWASVSDTKVASETKSPRFANLTIFTRGQHGQLFRAIVTLTWWYNGQADGVAQAQMSYYQSKFDTSQSIGDVYDVCPGVIPGPSL